MKLRAILVVAVACGPRPVAPLPEPTHPPVVASTPMSPTRATYHPLPSQWRASDALDVADNVRLVVGASGQRWLVTTSPAPTDADPDATRVELTGAAMFAREDLVAVRRRANGYVFVGDNGATYFAANPLDDFTTRRAPPEPLRSAAAGQQALVGITLRDTLVRSVDDGATWTAIASPKTAAVPLEAAAGRAGEGLILAAPGHVWASLDDLATWTPIPSDGIAPSEVFAVAEGTVWARGISPGVRASRTGLATLTLAMRVLHRAPDGSPKLDKAPPQFAPTRDGDEDLGWADAAQHGMAVWTGKRYLELKPTDQANIPQSIVVQDGAVERLPAIPAATDCEIAAVAGDGNVVEVECLHDVDGRKVARLLRSLDFGATFTVDDELETGSSYEHHLWVSAKGSVIVDGTCTAQLPGCGESGVFVRPRGGNAFVPAALQNGIHVQRVRFAADGQRVYAIAFDDDTAKLVLLVSTDGARSFAVKALPDLDGEVFTDSTELAYDEGAHRVVVILERDPAYRFTTRDDGATWDTMKLPFVADAVSLAGKRGLATSGRGIGWETLDAGATWTEVPIPPASPRGTTTAVACSEQACIIGDLAIRDGWEVARTSDVKPVSPLAPKVSQHRPMLDCKADGPEVALGAISNILLEPSPAFSWVTTQEGAGGAFDVVAMPSGARAPSNTQLLPATNVLSAVRREVTPEGATAVRIAKVGGANVDVEVAWWVASTGKVHRATIANASPPLTRGVPNALAAIVPGYGLYLHLPSSPLWLARETGATVTIPAPPQFPSVITLAARRIGARTQFAGPPLQVYGDRSVVFANMPDKGGLDVFAWNLWPKPADKTRVPTVTTADDHVIVAWPGNDLVAPRAWSLVARDPVGDPPEPTPLPTAKDELPPCAKGATGPRAALPWVAGSRTPIVVHAGTRTLYHATENVIARGGCAVAIEAGPTNSPRQIETTLVGSDLHGFAFFPSRHTESVVPITCMPSSAALPANYSTARGM